MSPSSFSIPTVDISPYLLSPTSAEALHVISEVSSACQNTGFFQLLGHGIPRELQERLFAASTKLFALSTEEKMKLGQENSVAESRRGYEVIGGQGLEEGKLPDLKEAYTIAQDIPVTDPRMKDQKAFLMGPNLWPSESILSPSEFKVPCEEYLTKIFALSLQVLDIVAATLPYGPDVFKEYCANDPISSVRLLHYPPDTMKDENQLGTGAHTDFGSITLLLQGDIGGLQVWDGQGNGEDKWRDVPPNPDAYVVNIGDMLQMLTGGRYKSSLHRVVNRSGKNRYSVPFFFDGNRDCVLKPLDGTGEGKYLTVEEHMRERFESTYGGVKERDENLKG